MYLYKDERRDIDIFYCGYLIEAVILPSLALSRFNDFSAPNCVDLVIKREKYYAEKKVHLKYHQENAKPSTNLYLIANVQYRDVHQIYRMYQMKLYMLDLQ